MVSENKTVLTRENELSVCWSTYYPEMQHIDNSEQKPRTITRAYIKCMLQQRTCKLLGLLSKKEWFQYFCWPIN